ncbi:MAG TPA: TetR family transcriptional regulator, partial [Kineosporiaceae bacterium]
MTAEPVDRPAATRRRRARATSQELVGAAQRVIAREGVGAATTRKIAEEAGVPLGTVHYWFTDKNDLFSDVIRAVLDRLEQAVAATGMARDGCADDVRQGLHAAWNEIVTDDPGAQLGLYELTALAVRTPGMRRLARQQYT